jgi:uncharacterized repeat protein (TIGR04138 family)
MLDALPELGPECPGCRYNLRTRPRAGVCPECGGSYEFDLTEYVAACAGLSPRLLVMIGQAMSVYPPGIHLTARDVCLAVRDLASARGWDDRGIRDLLRECGIRRSEDIGVGVYVMVAGGVLAVNEGDAPADFDGLFDLDGLVACKDHPPLPPGFEEWPENDAPAKDGAGET